MGYCGVGGFGVCGANEGVIWVCYKQGRGLFILFIYSVYISATPFGVGAVYDQHWKDKYLKDEFGRVQYREVVIPAKIKDKKIIIPARKEMQPILNPNYDASKEYVSRASRKEWSPVGLIGQLVVRDNGVCTVGGYCKAGADGLAVPATRTDEFHYRVIERTSENTIRVFFK